MWTQLISHPATIDSAKLSPHRTAKLPLKNSPSAIARAEDRSTLTLDRAIAHVVGSRVFGGNDQAFREHPLLRASDCRANFLVPWLSSARGSNVVCG